MLASDEWKGSEGTDLAISTTLWERNDDMTANEASCCQEQIGEAGTTFTYRQIGQRYMASMLRCRPLQPCFGASTISVVCGNGKHRR